MKIATSAMITIPRTPVDTLRFYVRRGLVRDTIAPVRLALDNPDLDYQLQRSVGKADAAGSTATGGATLRLGGTSSRSPPCPDRRIGR
jgi:hypothetical protein